MEKIDANDLITLDDDSKYYILTTINDFGSKFHLIIGYDEDQEEFDEDDVSFVEEIEDDGDIYLEPVENPRKLETLGYYVLTDNMVKAIPGLDEELIKGIEEKIYKGSK